MLTPDFLAYLVEAPSLTQALKTLRYAEETGYPSDRGRLTALLSAQVSHDRRSRILKTEFDVPSSEIQPRLYAAV